MCVMKTPASGVVCCSSHSAVETLIARCAAQHGGTHLPKQIVGLFEIVAEVKVVGIAQHHRLARFGGAIELARAGLKTHPEDRDFIGLLRHAQQAARSAGTEPRAATETERTDAQLSG
jgi:hypothetical protein